MKTILLLLLLAFYSSNVTAQDFRALMTINHSDHGPFLVDEKNDLTIPVVIPNPETRERVRKLPIGTVALIQGNVEFDVSANDDRHTMKKFLVVHNITPIELRDLRIEEKLSLDGPQFLVSKSPDYYPAPSIYVSTEIASAMTMTGAFLLFESLSATPNDIDTNRDIQKGLLLSAGTLATLLFIYDQYTGKTKP